MSKLVRVVGVAVIEMLAILRGLAGEKLKEDNGVHRNFDYLSQTCPLLIYTLAIAFGAKNRSTVGCQEIIVA